ncbi:MAG: Nif3-like dinuclear metal center hexameric protein [Verrucomicrobiae bacterium]|nr:Nif3-like dinuclear metal center hexameric protein [Verrucomicrobiae bacterium]
MKIQAVIDYVQGKTGYPLRSDEGFIWGDAEREVKKAFCCWMMDAGAIQAAADGGCSHMIVHESPFFPCGVMETSHALGEWAGWPVNRRRLELLKKHDLTVVRIHGSMDEMTILDCFADQLQLGAPVVKKPEFVRIYQIPPTRLEPLIERVKKAVKMDRLRVAVPPGFDRTVERVGLPWGGMGLFVNVGYLRNLLEEGAGVFIGGETDSYAMRFATEAGIPYIETSHEASETEGIRVFAEWIGKDLGIKTIYYEMKTPWFAA